MKVLRTIMMELKESQNVQEWLSFTLICLSLKHKNKYIKFELNKTLVFWVMLKLYPGFETVYSQIFCIYIENLFLFTFWKLTFSGDTNKK